MAYVGEALGGGWRIAITITVLVSLAAALQTTLVYLTRSFFAMGRDGVLPQPFGVLDAREQPAFAVGRAHRGRRRRAGRERGSFPASARRSISSSAARPSFSAYSSC